MTPSVALPGHKISGIVPPEQAAELGLARPVPILEVPWTDGRQTCALAHDYLAGVIEGRLEEYSACHSFAAGVCRGTGGAGLPCLFHEPEGSPGWQRARTWQRVQLADGTAALVPRSQEDPSQ